MLLHRLPLLLLRKEAIRQELKEKLAATSSYHSRYKMAVMTSLYTSCALCPPRTSTGFIITREAIGMLLCDLESSFRRTLPWQRDLLGNKCPQALSVFFFPVDPAPVVESRHIHNSVWNQRRPSSSQLLLCPSAHIPQPAARGSIVQFRCRGCSGNSNQSPWITLRSTSLHLRCRRQTQYVDCRPGLY